MEVEHKKGPWNFENYLLVVDRVKIGKALEDIPLFHVDFWVQILNLPVRLVLESVGRPIANYISEFVEYDKNDDTSFWRTYMKSKAGMMFGNP